MIITKVNEQQKLGFHQNFRCSTLGKIPPDPPSGFPPARSVIFLTEQVLR